MATKKKWMQKAFGKNKGALHRALGVPEDENIPPSKLKAAAKKGGKLGMRARAAKTGSKISKKNARKKRK
jgi:hypothetical protein